MRARLADASGETWDNQCFTYDVMGELVNAWTSKVTPDGNATGCKSTGGTTWGYRTDFAPSSGPVADAPDAATDVSSPDASLTSTLAATAPDAGTVATGATAYRQSFTFDWLGNRAAMTEHDTADATKNVSFTYGYGNPQPHTMKSITSNPSGKGSSYRYDAVGNTEVRDLSNTTQSLTWTSENKLDTITDDGKKTTYVYDANGNRILENSPSGSTLYLGETELTTDSSGTITRASRAYTQPGAPTVIRMASNGATTGHKLSVLLADHVGTANTSVELSSGQPVTRRAFKPYGELRGPKPPSWPNKRGYLGVGIDDSATGLTHIGAREYDQNSGRFLSADPVIDIADPLQMNGFAYSNNSPVSSSDPSGLCRRDICGDGKRAGYTGQHKGEHPCTSCNTQNVGHFPVNTGKVPQIKDPAIGVVIPPGAPAVEKAVERYVPGILSRLFREQKLIRIRWNKIFEKPAGLSEEQWDSTVGNCMSSTGLREGQCRKLPVFVVDGKRTPEIAINDRSAIDKGYPVLLHYAKSATKTRENREFAGCGSAWSGSGSCDEYPFASTLEGGLGAQTRGVPLLEQHKQGSDLSAFYRSNKLQANDPFLVAVINVRRREDGVYVAG